MLTGIILAAGRAERQPMKWALPIDNENICIESAVYFCHNNHCDTITVVCDEVVERVLEMRGHMNLRYVRQVGSGVCAAIRSGAQARTSVLVAFCDNVYDEREQIWTGADVVASVRIPRQGFEGLDGWDTGWVHRGSRMECAFAGWLYIDGHTELPREDEPLIRWLHRVGAYAYRQRDDYAWWDIGSTPHAYGEYLDARKSR